MAIPTACIVAAVLFAAILAWQALRLRRCERRLAKLRRRRDREAFANAAAPAPTALPPADPASSRPLLTAVAPPPAAAGAADIPPVIPPPSVDVCTWGDRASFVRGNGLACLPSDRRSFVSTGARCAVGDAASPTVLAAELQQLDQRRAEIVSKLGTSATVKVGCTADADCNVFSYADAKNVCGLNNECHCAPGNGTGPFCQFMTRYKDPKDMTADERKRFKAMRDLSQMTPRDYFNWLRLYAAEPGVLSADHLTNFNKLMQGEAVPKSAIPLARDSPPAASASYVKLLGGLPTTVPESKSPWMAANYNAYDAFMGPEEAPGVRVIDQSQKADATALAAQFNQSDRPVPAERAAVKR